MMNHPPSHAFMSEVILEDWLDGRGWDCSWTFGCILGTHHGTTPSSDSVLDGITSASRNFPNENLGDDDWRAVQEELLGWMFEESGMAKFESVFSSSPVPQPEQALVSALVIVADWIASNSDLFPLDSCIGSYDEFIKRTDAAWASLALPSAWQAMPVKEEGQELFHHRFIGLPAGGIRHGRRRATHYRSAHGQRQNRGRTDVLRDYGSENRGRGNRLSSADNGNFQRDVQAR